MPDAATALRKALGATRLKAIARVLDSNCATDFAIALSAKRLAVIRCMDSATQEDRTALATMFTEGDFVWAGLIYGERDGSETAGLIETFHVGELDRLVARLLELREAFGEAG